MTSNQVQSSNVVTFPRRIRPSDDAYDQYYAEIYPTTVMDSEELDAHSDDLFDAWWSVSRTLEDALNKVWKSSAKSKAAQDREERFAAYNRGELTLDSRELAEFNARSDRHLEGMDEAREIYEAAITGRLLDIDKDEDRARFLYNKLGSLEYIATCGIDTNLFWRMVDPDSKSRCLENLLAARALLDRVLVAASHA
ncbi:MULTISPECIES: hypothetical protein [unclassified Chelatococcus]|uniref:hypothetical protein n=1 Tax=unclassified Chelatococcus TaxID=2638111 RepID=UPI001BCF8543|nr:MULTISPECIES: hypothetical protein [unclassified Chelatococcus]CAH1672332.1 hypothetical protein CHELA20_50906 [Hyphomicrobiales bacterium]MBS7738961.1 hypothetical protein [Chelatococcus sp. HY11]MBX3543394.1 hypothetical protein [Chelatococcus sp.]MCO5076509.1 hypothetical protein [Chelatococcus sp.]CAH1675436.1 hypothetical protein CHELA41_24107 [Hyphomicrobiales bacterium]